MKLLIQSVTFVVYYAIDSVITLTIHYFHSMIDGRVTNDGQLMN